VAIWKAGRIQSSREKSVKFRVDRPAGWNDTERSSQKESGPSRALFKSLPVAAGVRRRKPRRVFPSAPGRRRLRFPDLSGRKKKIQREEPFAPVVHTNGSASGNGSPAGCRGMCIGRFHTVSSSRLRSRMSACRSACTSAARVFSSNNAGNTNKGYGVTQASATASLAARRT
jgi:hypothetical protein